MILYAATYYETDGYTYGVETVLAICDSKSKADEVCLKDNEVYPARDLTYYEVKEFEINQLWE